MELDQLSPKSLEDLVMERRTLESIQIEQLSDEQWIESLLFSDLSFCPHKTFQKLLKNSKILNKVSLYLLKVHGCEQKSVKEKAALAQTELQDDGLKQPRKFTRAQLDEALLRADKELYLKFRSKKLTLDQLQARTAEKLGHCSQGYVVLDDIRAGLHPSVLKTGGMNAVIYQMRTHGVAVGDNDNGPRQPLNPKKALEALRKPFEPWELNTKCIKSLTFHQGLY